MTSRIFFFLLFVFVCVCLFVCRTSVFTHISCIHSIHLFSIEYSLVVQSDCCYCCCCCCRRFRYYCYFWLLENFFFHIYRVYNKWKTDSDEHFLYFVVVVVIVVVVVVCLFCFKSCDVIFVQFVCMWLLRPIV